MITQGVPPAVRQTDARAVELSGGEGERRKLRYYKAVGLGFRVSCCRHAIDTSNTEIADIRPPNIASSTINSIDERTCTGTMEPNALFCESQVSFRTPLMRMALMQLTHTARPNPLCCTYTPQQFSSKLLRHRRTNQANCYGAQTRRPAKIRLQSVFRPYDPLATHRMPRQRMVLLCQRQNWHCLARRHSII